MSKHTPGPWNVDCNQFGTMPTCQYIVRSSAADDNGVSNKGGVMIVGVGDCGWSDCDGPSLTSANAHLIAAAPDTYAACVGLLDAIHDSMTHESQRFHAAQIDAARAAIAKAEGSKQ